MEGTATISRTLARPGHGGWLLALVGGCVAYAAFANAATSIPEETRVQIALASGLLVAGVGLFTGAVGLARSPLAWAGVGLLAFYALFSAISVSWSLAPDQGWLATNRAAGYAAAIAIVLISAPSVRRAPELALAAYLAIAIAVALYALGGKLFPELSIGPIDLDHASQFSRLREPLGYWNALGLLLVMATPACVWIAADRSRPDRWRVGGLLCLTLLVATIPLTYSRGAVLAFIAALAVMVVAAPAAAEKLRRLGVAGVAILGAAPSLIFAFSVDALSENGVPASERAGDGALLAFILAVSLLVVAGAGIWALGAERRVIWTPDHERWAWTGLVSLAVAAVFIGLVAMAASDRGLTGQISHQWDEFRSPVEISNDPDRLVSASGSNRWIWWGEASGAFWDRPIAGWGAGSFPILHFHYSEHQTQARSTHNVPLQFLSETGLIGAAIVLAALSVLAVAALRQLRRSEGTDHGARLALFAAAAAWAIHTLYDWDWEIPAVTLPALAAAAIAASPYGPNLIRFPGEETGEPRGVSRIGRPLADRKPPLDARSPAAVPALLGAAIVTAILVISAALPSLAHDKVVEAQTQAAAEGADEGAARAAIDDAVRAQELNPLAIEPLFTEAALRERLGELDRAEQLLIEAARLQPDSIRPWQRLLTLESRIGNVELTKLALQKSVEADPGALAFGQLGAGLAFTTAAPPDRSPTALGTPPR